VRRFALGLELALHATLVVFLAVAAYKFFRMLDRLHVSWVKGLPVALLFAAAGVFVTRRGAQRMRLPKRDGDDDDSKHDRR
jgi:hypothetical protein